MIPKFIYAAATLCAITTVADAASTKAEDAIGYARASGAVIGASITCGLATERAVPVGRKAIDFAQKIDPTIPFDAIAEAHTEGVREATLATRGASKKSCRSIINTYKEFEDDMTIRK